MAFLTWIVPPHFGHFSSIVSIIGFVFLHSGYPGHAKNFPEIIYQAIEKKIPYGIYNATNEGYTTWYDFTKEILEEQGITCKVNPVTTEQYIEMMKVTQAKRPFNSQMSKAKLEACGIKVPEWKDGLKRYLEEAKSIEQ